MRLIAILYDWYATKIQNTFLVTLNETAMDRMPPSFHRQYAPIFEIYADPDIEKQLEANKKAIHQDILKNRYCLIRL